MCLLHLLIFIEIMLFANGNGFDRDSFQLYRHRVEDVDRSTQDTYDGGIFRLTRDIQPESYEIWIQTDIDKGDIQFSGRVKIILNAKEFCNLSLHAKNLEIIHSYLLNIDENGASENVPILDVIVATDEIIEIIIEGCYEGKFQLEFEYKGVLRDDFLGFYKSSYTNVNGKSV